MFLDRDDAGRQLAEKVKKYQDESPLVLALPRGGVPIGYQVSKHLHCPLDVFVVRKIGAPGNPEFGVGGVAPSVLILEEHTLHSRGFRFSDIEETIEREQKEMKRRLQVYRGGTNFTNVTGQTVILVDDGIATGVTMRAAIQSIKKLDPKKLILAVPVAASDAIHLLRNLVDEFICLETPLQFYAVGEFYRHFPQVSDNEVILLLKEAKQNMKEGKI